MNDDGSQHQRERMAEWRKARYEFQLAKAALLHDVLQFADLVKETDSGGDEEHPTVDDIWTQTRELQLVHEKFGLEVNWYMNSIHEGCDRSWVYAQEAMAKAAQVKAEQP